jgi:hypothetical protein
MASMLFLCVCYAQSMTIGLLALLLLVVPSCAYELVMCLK